MKEFMKHSWLIILIVIIILGLPIFLNFIVFKPTSQLSVGTLQDWMSFWGSYLSAVISAAVAFLILAIQRRDNKREGERNRLNNHMQNARNRHEAYRVNNEIRDENKSENRKNRQLQLNILSYQQEMQWLGELRDALVNHICAYSENGIRDIINSVCDLSFESVQLKIKTLFDNLTQTDTTLAFVISGNPRTTIGSTYQKEMKEWYNRYKSIIDDTQILVCLYYNKIPVSNSANDDILQLFSSDLKNLIKIQEINPLSINYDQFAKLTHQLIKPLPDIFEGIRNMSSNCILHEKERIDFILKENLHL